MADKDQDQIMTAEGAASQEAPTKEALFEEVKYVFDILDKLDFKSEAIPDVVFLISSSWFNKWKQRVNYTKFSALMKASALSGKAGGSTGAVGGAGGQPGQTSTDGNNNGWANGKNPFASDFSGGGQGSLGAKMEAEKRFNEEKAAKEQAQSSNEEPKAEAVVPKGDEGLNAETCFTDEHMTRLVALSAITNIDLLQDFSTYIRDSTIQPNSTNIENFGLRSGLNFEKDVVAVSEAVYSFLAGKYGADFALPRAKAAKGETWRWSVKDQYDVALEEVRLLVMKQEDEPCAQIQIRAKDGSVMALVPQKPVTKSPVPTQQQPKAAPPIAAADRPIPAAAAAAIPKPPGLPPSTVPLNVQEAPKPAAAIPLPPAPVAGAKALPPPPGGKKPPPIAGNVKPGKTYDYSVQHQSIYVQKSQSLTSMKARIAASLNVDPDSIRLWSFEHTAGYTLDSVATALVKGYSAHSLTKLVYSPWKADKITEGPLVGAEINKGPLFPGKSLDVAECRERLIGSFNTKADEKNPGRLCRDKEVVVVETLDKDGHFTFRFSSIQANYSKCKRALCGRIGLLDKVGCECGKVFYCSEDCAGKDNSHRDSCPEYKKKLLDPSKISDVLDEDPKNGICGLVNLGNTCYMNSALQCISHTMPMVHYFARTMQFKNNLNYKNPLASQHCELAILFTKLIRELWNTPKANTTGFGGSSYSPKEIKTSIGTINGLFKGYQQHDSNELIQFLLDQLHEDLNRVDQPSVKQTFANPTHEQVAAEKLTEEQQVMVANEAHLKLNESMIQDLFFGQQLSTIICNKCKIPSKKLGQIMTLPVHIPTLSFNMKFTFVPYLPNEKLFSFEIKNISTQGDQGLYQIKKKISEIAKHYYKETHYSAKHKKSFKWPLTTRSQQSIELTAHDILLASLNVQTFLPVAQQKKFFNIFGDHKHTLADLQEDATTTGINIVAYQLDPWAVDIDKITTHEYNGTGHELTFPSYLKPGFIVVPVEVGCLAKKDPNADKDPFCLPLPSRIVIVDKSWTTQTIFKTIMSIFVKALDNKSAQGHQSGYQQMTEQQDDKKRKPRRSRLRDHVADSEYGYKGNQSDQDSSDERAQNEIPGGKHGFGDDDMIGNNPQEEVQTLNHKAHYTYDEVFGYLEMFSQQKGSYPPFDELNHFKNPTSEFLQSMGLYVVTPNTPWHLMINQTQASQLLGTLMDQEKFEGNNNYIFDQPNPESMTPAPVGRLKILKFRLIYSIPLLPEGVQLIDVLQHFAMPADNEIYKKDFKFDDQHRIRSAGSDNDNDQINSSGGDNASSSAMTIEKCLKAMSQSEQLTGYNQYDCTNCKSKQNATKFVQLHKTPPVLVLTIQRFKNGQKNTDVVKFPRLGLDMKDLTITKEENAESHIYDLYGVVNHSGSLGFGHYTAMCFNEIEEKWYNFNDSFVTEIKPPDVDKDLQTNRAYVLFYMRRGFECADQEDFDKIKVSSTGAADWLFKKAKAAAVIEEAKEKEKAAKESKAKVAEDPPNFKGQAAGAVPSGAGESGTAKNQAKMSAFQQSVNQYNPLANAQDANLEDLQQMNLIDMMKNDPNQQIQSAVEGPSGSLEGQGFGDAKMAGEAAAALAPSDSDEERKED